MTYLWCGGITAPALLRDALHRFGGMAVWKPRWYILAVPTEAVMGGARSVFSLAALDERRECSVIRVTNPEYLVPSTPSATNVPPLRIAPRVCGWEARGSSGAIDFADPGSVWSCPTISTLCGRCASPNGTC